MKQYLCYLTLTIASLSLLGQSAASIATTPIAPSIAVQKSLSLNQEIDYKIMLDRLFKKGQIEDKWFPPASPSQRTGRNARLLELKKKSTQYFGKYRSVRNEGKNYVATFERGEIILEFLLDREQRILGMSAKPK
jgi:hypothetical protein